MLLVAFREKKSLRKPVLMLSTCEGAGMKEVRTAAGILKQKPKCVAAYNKYMGGVDISDRKIYHVSAERLNAIGKKSFSIFWIWRCSTAMSCTRVTLMLGSVTYVTTSWLLLWRVCVPQSTQSQDLLQSCQV